MLACHSQWHTVKLGLQASAGELTADGAFCSSGIFSFNWISQPSLFRSAEMIMHSHMNSEYLATKHSTCPCKHQTIFYTMNKLPFFFQFTQHYYCRKSQIPPCCHESHSFVPTRQTGLCFSFLARIDQYAPSAPVMETVMSVNPRKSSRQINISD